MLTFGGNFHPSLEGVTLLSSVVTRFRWCSDSRNICNPVQRIGMRHAAGWPSDIAPAASLQTLTFGFFFLQKDFSRSLGGVMVLSSLRMLTFGGNLHQSLEGVTLPSSVVTRFG